MDIWVVVPGVWVGVTVLLIGHTYVYKSKGYGSIYFLETAIYEVEETKGVGKCPEIPCTITLNRGWRDRVLCEDSMYS